MQSQTGLHVVDLGCGSAPYRPLFPKETCYTTVDLPGNPLASVFFNASDGRTPLGDACADVVLSTQVLEHVDSPAAYLSEACRLCKPGGLLILSTHGFWFYHPTPSDYWRWTASGLRKLLRHEGWDVVDLNGVLGFAAAALSLLQEALEPRLPVFLQRPCTLAMQGLIGAVDHFYSADGRRENAAVYLVVARKSVATVE